LHGSAVHLTDLNILLWQLTVTGKTNSLVWLASV